MSTDSILRPGELKEVLLKEIQAADLAEIDVREVGTVLEVKDGIARIYGLTSAMAGEMLEFTASGGGGRRGAGRALNPKGATTGPAIAGTQQDGDRDRHDHQPEGHRRDLRVRGDRAEGLDRRGRSRETQGIRRDGLYDRRAGIGFGAGADAVHRAILGMRDGRVLYVRR